MPNWPVAIKADGCSTNVSAGAKMLSHIGIVSPNMQCATHTADGSLKRMANPKSMNVAEVIEFLPYFRKVIKHFKLSGKSTCSLNEALEVMGMKKVHMASFCPTRMSYLLSACAQAVSLLVPLCNVLVSLDLKEHRDYFLSPKSMSVMHALADLDPFWKEFTITIQYLKKFGCSKEELIREFKNLYPVCNKLWPKYSHNKKTGNHDFWMNICSLYTIPHPNICKLVRILFTSAGILGLFRKVI